MRQLSARFFSSYQFVAFHILVAPAATDKIDHGRERIQTLEEHIDIFVTENEAPRANEPQEILHGVRKCRHLLKTHRGGHSFERVRDAEYLVDDAHVALILLCRKKEFVQMGKVIARFV